MNGIKVKQLAVVSVMIAAAMILSYVESLIPVFIPVPGLKIGLANVVSVVCLVLFGFRTAGSISLVRVCLSALLFGNAVGFIYSLCGAVLSMLVMLLLKYTRIFSTVGISVGGAVAHNIGQVLAACVVMGTAAVLAYLPILLVGGVIAGIVIGLVAGLLCARLKDTVKL